MKVIEMLQYNSFCIRKLRFTWVLIALFSFSSNAFSQTDREFWFVVPEVTILHNYPGGISSYFKFSSGSLPSTVTVSMPANQYNLVTNPTGFEDIVINMPANSFHVEDISKWIFFPYPTPRQGVLFNYDIASSTYNKNLNFTGNATGTEPFGSVIESAPGILYGMTYTGGANNLGAIFEYNIATNTYTRKHSFQDNGANLNGRNPYGSLFRASNGLLYGMTNTGGANNLGVIFDYNTAGAGTYTKRHEFVNAGANLNGRNPYGSLIEPTNNLLYGMTFSGGVNNLGVIFEYNITTNTYTRKHSFQNAGANLNGSNPYGSLLRASNGLLYGMTYSGGANGFGVIFEFNTAGAGTFTKRFDFTSASGRNPFGSLIEAGGKLWGLTSGGGANDMGTIFEFVTGTGICTKRFDFSGALDGQTPVGTLMLGSNGNLFGMTRAGGLYNLGVVFEFNPVTFQLTVIHNFTGSFVGLNEGNTPFYGSLLEVNNRLYGLTVGLAPQPAFYDVNQIENKPLNASGINNFGIHITATSPITCYYETSNSNNKDIWALKGRNAIGTEFYTSFQTDRENQGSTQAYSAIDIVATEDTEVTFTLPHLIGASSGTGPETDYPAVPGGYVIPPITLTRGQTFSLFPLNKSQLAASRLVGTRISSTSPIAVTLKDDSFHHTGGGCYDIAGDQIISTDIIGKEYAVIRTFLYENATDNRHDHIYILAPEGGTTVNVYNTAGAPIAGSPFLLGARQQKYIRIPDPETYYHIKADKPVYVWHVGGFGCEVGGAILPPIDKCTGVPQVSFARTSTEDFYVIMMVRKGAETGFKFDGVVRNDLFPSGTFINIFDPTSEWSVARFGPFTPAQIAVGTHKMENSMDIFHLGIVNGGASSGCFYGYFSDYNEFNPQTFVVGDVAQSNARLCYGDDAQLYASGGTNYLWTPTTFLSDPTIDIPMALNVTSNEIYNVNISGACGNDTTLIVTVRVGGPIDINFISDFDRACATKINPADPAEIPKATFNFTNKSTGGEYRSWSYRLAGDVNWTEFASGDNTGLDSIDQAHKATLILENNTNTFLDYEILLVVHDELCFRELIKTVRIFPFIDVSPIADITNGCMPLNVNFQANPLGHSTGATYLWNFGDNATTNTLNSSHEYFDPSPPYSVKNFNATVTITDQWNVCSSTRPVVITVQPYVKAGIVSPDPDACSPLNPTIVNTSVGLIDNYNWTLNGFNVGNTAAVPALNLLNTRTDNLQEVYTLRLTVRNAFAGGGCPDFIEREYKVSPNPSASVSVNVNPLSDPNCSPLVFDLSATSIENSDSYIWSRDTDPLVINPISSTAVTTDTIDNFTASPQDYYYKFNVENNWGCKFQPPAIPVTVQPFVSAVMVVDNEVGCSPLTVNFTNSSSIGTTEWEWDIYDDATIDFNDRDIALPQTYTNTTTTLGVLTVPVRLTTRNSAGCEATVVKDITINPRATASFTSIFEDKFGNVVVPGVDQLCSPVYADFTGVYENAESYTWQFGTIGGSIDPSPSLVELFNNTAAPTNIDVTLLASNSFGCPAPLQTATYTIQPEITAAFSFVTDGYCAPVSVDVAAQLVVGGTYNWTLDGAPWGNLQSQNLSISENKTGVDQIFRIQLRVENGTCFDISPEFAVVVHPEVEAKWNLPDIIAPSCNPYNFSIENQSTLYNSAIVPTNTQWQITSTDYNTTETNNILTRELVNESSEDPKVFDLTLTATSDDGCFETKTAQIEVYPKIVPFFNAEVTEICTPLELLVADASLTTSTGSTWTWDWDGGTATNLGGQNYSVIFQNPGPNVDSKILNLSLENDYGCVESYSFNLDVLPQVTSSFALAAGSNAYHCGEGTVTFENLSTGGSRYTWSFAPNDDFSTTSTLPLNHTFTNNTLDDITYNVKLNTYNNYECDDEFEIPITVHPKVQANFSFSVPDQCAYPLGVNFVNSSIVGNTTANNSVSFNWDYGYIWLGNPQNEVRPTAASHNYAFFNGQANTTSTYTITLNPQQLHSVSGLTCEDVVTKTVTVYPELIANFNLPTSEGCNPLAVDFVNNSSGVMASQGGRFEWTLSDNSYSALETPANKTYSHTDKTQSIFYPVNLKIVNPIGCEKNASHTIEVYPLVEANFIAENPVGCSPLDVVFQNLSTSPAYQYNWDFVYNGQNSALGQPGNIRFENVPANPYIDILQNYTPTVSLTTGLSAPYPQTCAKTVTAPITVYPRVYPQFSGNFEVCYPTTVQFANSTNAFGGIANASYLWSFGNTVTSIQQSPSQNYINASFSSDSVFNVKLIATSVHNCKDSVDHVVTVHPKPRAKMELVSDYISCPPFNVEIQNQSQGTNLNYIYDFGDTTADSTTTSAANMVHTYNNVGSVIEPYTFMLTATTEHGCVDNTSQTVYVFPDVTAEFEFNPGNAACNPFVDTMDNQSVNAQFFEWNFGDGQTSYLSNPFHRFINNTNRDSIFNVELIAVSVYDCDDTISYPLTVYAAPAAEFVITPPLKVFPDATFNFKNYTEPNSPTWNYTWTFGDGWESTSNTMETFTHTYDIWGPRDEDFKYSVWLKVENDYCSDSIQHFLTLRPAEPEVLFSSAQYEDCDSLTVNFINGSQYGNTYTWYVDTTFFSAEFEPVYTFREPGYYNVTLVVTGDGGVQHYNQTYQVFESPIADFKVAPERVLLPNADVRLFDLSKYATTYLWNVGDGTTYTDRNPIHKYTEIGEYRVTLTVWSDKGCENTTSKFPAVWVEGYGDLRFPNAFIPSKLGPSENGEYDAVDFSNQIFHPVHHGVEEYKLTVFNRWGQQIFESKNVLVGWDGYYNGKPLPQDVYVWRATGKFVNGQQFDMRGNVTLLR